jgi:hypothetical protein
MMTKTFMAVTLTAAMAFWLADAGNAEEKAAGEAATPAPSEEAVAKSLAKLVFVPHDSGAPVVTETGGVRAVTVLPKVQLLAPRRMARTHSPSPTLYWHISKAATGHVWFTLISDDPAATEPLAEIKVDGVDQEGIYGVDLDDHGVTLEPNKRYVWSVIISTESSGFGSDQLAQTLLEHSPDADLAEALTNMAPEDRAIRLAADGYWYDAIETLSEQINADAGPNWKAARARLLDQTGLLQAARFDQR